MGLIYDGKEVNKVIYDGQEVNRVVYDGQTVWQKDNYLNITISDGKIADAYLDYAEGNYYYPAYYVCTMSSPKPVGEGYAFRVEQLLEAAKTFTKQSGTLSELIGYKAACGDVLMILKEDYASPTSPETKVAVGFRGANPGLPNQWAHCEYKLTIKNNLPTRATQNYAFVDQTQVEWNIWGERSTHNVDAPTDSIQYWTFELNKSYCSGKIIYAKELISSDKYLRINLGSNYNFMVQWWASKNTNYGSYISNVQITQI